VKDTATTKAPAGREAHAPSPEPSPVPTGEGAVAVGVDEAAVRREQARVDRKAKGLKAALAELAEATGDLRQAALFGEPEFEPGLFLSGEDLRKRYTGKQATKMEWRRNACIRMLAYGIPAEDIAQDLHMNLRTIQALATQNGKTLAAFSEKFAGELMGSAAADIALAETKRHEASHKDLHIAAGIKMQHALAVKLVADTGPAPVDVEAESGKLKALRDRIAQLKPAEAEQNAEKPTAGEPAQPT